MHIKSILLTIFCLTIFCISNAKPRFIFLDEELKYASYMDEVVIDYYDGKGNIFFHSIHHQDTLQSAFAHYYGTEGQFFKNPDSRDLTANWPLKKDTVLIVLDSMKKVSLFAKIEKNRYRFWSPFFTLSIALFKFSAIATPLSPEKILINPNTNKEQLYTSCWDGCYMDKLRLMLYTSNARAFLKHYGFPL